MKQSSFLDQVNGSTEATVGKVFEQQMGIDERVLDRLLNRALDPVSYTHLRAHET